MVRVLFRVLILVLLPLSGFAAPVTRAGMPMVICGSAGARTIWVDASGVPTEIPQDCDQCVLCLSFSLGPLPDPVILTQPLAFAMISLPGAPGWIGPAGDRTAPLPRGPPTAKSDEWIAFTVAYASVVVSPAFVSNCDARIKRAQLALSQLVSRSGRLS